MCIGKNTKLQCNVAKSFGNIATSSFTHGDLLQKWESRRELAKKVGFAFSVVQYVIKCFLATKLLGNDCRNSRPKTLNLTQSRSLI